MTEVILGFAGALLAATLGFLGAIYVERRREWLARRAKVNPMLLEMALLEGTLQEAIETGRRMRELLRRDAWDAFQTDLVNWLPLHLVKALHLQENEFDTICKAYTRLASPAGVLAAERDAIFVTFWVYVYKSQRLRELIQAAERKARSTLLSRLLRIPRAAKEEQSAFRELVKQLDSGVVDFLRSKGYDPGSLQPFAIEEGAT